MTHHPLSCRLLIQNQSFALCHAIADEYLAQPTQWRGRLMMSPAQTPQPWINQPATLIIAADRQPLRQFRGLLQHLTVVPATPLNQVDFILRSKLSLLQSQAPARLVTQCSAMDMIQQLMSTYSLSYCWRIQGCLPQPEFWRQPPGETDWQFLLHILRQIGAYCWCDYSAAGEERIIFANQPTAHSSHPQVQPFSSVVATRQDTPSGIRLLDDYQGQLLQAQVGEMIEHQWHGLGAYSTLHAHDIVHWRQQAHKATSFSTVQTCLPDLALATFLTLATQTWLVTGIRHAFTAGDLPYMQQLTLHPATVPWRLAPMAETLQPNWSLGRIHHTQRDTRQRYSVRFDQHPQTIPPAKVVKCALGASPGAPLPVGIHWPLTRHTKIIIQWIHAQRHQPVILAALADPTQPSVVTAPHHTQHRLQFDQHTGLLFEDAHSHAGIELFTPTSHLALKQQTQPHLTVHTEGALAAEAKTCMTWRSQQDLQGVIRENAQFHSDQVLRITSGRNTFSHAGGRQQLHGEHIKITAQQSMLRSKKNQRLFTRDLQLDCRGSFLGCSRVDNISLRADRLHIQGTGVGTFILRGGAQTYITLLADGSIHLYAPVIECRSAIHFNGEVQTVSAPPPIPRPKKSSLLPSLYPAWLTFPRAPTWQTPQFCE